MIVNPRALSNDWLFRQTQPESVILDVGNSIATAEREEAERTVVEWFRDHPRRPLGEWSDLADPFELAGREDWSPVRSVRLATPGRRATGALSTGRRSPDPGYVAFLALRRQRRREAQEPGTSS